MKTPVINGIRSAAEGFIDPALEALANRNQAEEWAETNVLIAMLEPLNLDGGTREKIVEQAMNIALTGEETGFRAGFRLAARLMVECLGDEETPERRTP